ncbi:TPA: IS3 family transposase [Bacillus cereus]
MVYQAIEEYIQFYNTEQFQEKLHGIILFLLLST